MFRAIPPVREYDPFIAPFLAEYACKQILAFRAPLPIDDIVAAHQRPGLCFTDGNLESAKMNFPESAQRDSGIAVFAVGFLVVAGKMLDTGSHSLGLDTADLCRSHFSCQEGIF